MTKPWRTVEHIEERKGRRGGAYWSLLLSCGHYGYRPIAPFKLFRLGNSTNTKTLIAPAVLAPQRMRCRWCT